MISNECLTDLRSTSSASCSVGPCTAPASSRLACPPLPVGQSRSCGPNYYFRFLAAGRRGAADVRCLVVWLAAAAKLQVVVAAAKYSGSAVAEFLFQWVNDIFLRLWKG